MDERWAALITKAELNRLAKVVRNWHNPLLSSHEAIEARAALGYDIAEALTVPKETREAFVRACADRTVEV